MKEHFSLLGVTKSLWQTNYNSQFKTAKGISCMMCMC